MASSDKPIYQFTEGVVAEDTLFPISYQNNGEYKTGNISAQSLGENLGNNFTNNNLNTSNKTLIGGINELLEVSDQTGISVKGTLDAGETELVLESSYIKEDSLLDFYTSIFGINPTAVETEEGSVTLTFPAQETDLDVEVVIRGPYIKNDEFITWDDWALKLGKALGGQTEYSIKLDTTTSQSGKYNFARMHNGDNSAAGLIANINRDFSNSIIYMAYPTGRCRICHQGTYTPEYLTWTGTQTEFNGIDYPTPISGSNTTSFTYFTKTENMSAHPVWEYFFGKQNGKQKQSDAQAIEKLNKAKNFNNFLYKFINNLTIIPNEIIVTNDGNYYNYYVYESGNKPIGSGTTISFGTPDAVKMAIRWNNSASYTTEIVPVEIETNSTDRGSIALTNVIYNTSDIVDANDNVLLAANCTLADFGVS